MGAGGVATVGTVVGEVTTAGGLLGTLEDVDAAEKIVEGLGCADSTNLGAGLEGPLELVDFLV